MCTSASASSWLKHIIFLIPCRGVSANTFETAHENDYQSLTEHAITSFSVNAGDLENASSDSKLFKQNESSFRALNLVK